ncbi:FAD monooxygenase [Apiospora kogelbergensis]|uniref:FAD monooxygenase n=1 Tax=Apiospora kogelbergensis TaxID=1337665 RepID=UPI003130214D
MNAVIIDVDIVIIGGGPTGLLCAVLARQLGLTVSVIDEKPATLDFGRADGLNARTQQYLEIAGTLKELRSKGIECDTSSTFADGGFKSRQSNWWTSLQHCHHKCFLMVGQPEVEKVLMSQLPSYRITKGFPMVRRNEVAMEIEEDDDGVTVISYAETETGNLTFDKITTRAKFAIGADGAHSLVRKSLKIGFEGTEPGMNWTVIDTLLSTDFPVCKEIISFQLHGESRVLWVPRERNLARFYVRLLEGQEITQANAEATIREHMAPYQVDFVHTEWFSNFEVRERLASSFVSKQGKGRIALAGDAAHVHSINGAQGLNTGIADAFGLVWRLALACKSTKNAETLMTSYALERRTIAQGAIGLAAQLVRDTRHGAERYVATIAKNAGYITGMGVSYTGIESPLVVESRIGIWRAGERCPDISFGSPNPSFEICNSATRKRLYSTVGYGRFILFLVGDQQIQIPPYGLGTGYALDIIMLLRTGAFPTHTIDFDGIDFSAFFWRVKFWLTEVVGPDDSFAVVVRPDMYIGCVGECATCIKYLDSFSQ